MLGCSSFVRQRCDAYLHPETPCWEHKVTGCEEAFRGPKDCQHCIVYNVHHSQQPTDTAVFY